eukprot:1860209-Rhodomonas_salina.2
MKPGSPKASVSIGGSAKQQFEAMHEAGEYSEPGRRMNGWFRLSTLALIPRRTTSGPPVWGGDWMKRQDQALEVEDGSSDADSSA